MRYPSLNKIIAGGLLWASIMFVAKPPMLGGLFPSVMFAAIGVGVLLRRERSETPAEAPVADTSDVDNKLAALQAQLDVMHNDLSLLTEEREFMRELLKRNEPVSQLAGQRDS